MAASGFGAPRRTSASAGGAPVDYSIPGVTQTSGGYGGWTNPLGPPTGQAQSIALANPAPSISETAINPMQQEAYNRASAFESGLGDRTNPLIQAALGRGRDEISVGMRSEGESAIRRGANPALFRSRALMSGERSLNDLNSKLTGEALGAQQGAISGMTSAAGSAAGTQLGLHLGNLSAQNAQQQTLIQQAEAQSRLNEAPYQRLMAMMDSISRNRDAYGALTSGTGLLSGSGGSRLLRGRNSLGLG